MITSVWLSADLALLGGVETPPPPPPPPAVVVMAVGDSSLNPGVTCRFVGLSQ
jgi:hypothetical protein